MPVLFIQGPPGSGKTTLIQHLVDILESRGVNIGGFYTSEVRRGGTRTGFDVVDISSSNSIPLARKSWQYPQTVGSYSVDVESFTQYIRSLPSSASTVIIDEIGKMELLSPDFLDWVAGHIKSQVVIGTIPARMPATLQKFLRSYEFDTIQITKDTRVSSRQQAEEWIFTHI